MAPKYSPRAPDPWRWASENRARMTSTPSPSPDGGGTRGRVAGRVGPRALRRLSFSRTPEPAPEEAAGSGGHTGVFEQVQRVLLSAGSDLEHRPDARGASFAASAGRDQRGRRGDEVG